jgi:iron complex outermembrane receptor protein
VPTPAPTPTGDTLSAVSITAQRQSVDPDTPAVVESITREQIDSHTNTSTEDA